MGAPGKSHLFKNKHTGINGKGTNKNNAKLKTSGKIKKKVIPVIYIPGIFASRLEKPDGEKVWDPDDKGFMLKKLTRGISVSKFFIFISTITQSKALWTDKEIENKVNLLTKSAQTMNIPGTPIRDTDDQESKVSEILDNSEVFESILDRNKIDRNNFITSFKSYNTFTQRKKRRELVKKIKQLATALHQVRRDRGWYTVLGEYFDIMERITLKDHDEFHFPTFGYGYDWRMDISESGDKFKQRIDEIVAIKEYPEFGELGIDYEIELSNKVIIVTHSMGSIVTRHASEISGAKGNIHGVLHLNQPTTGAPVLYRRFLTGTEHEKVPFNIFSLLKSIGDNVLNEILGTTSYHFTKLVGSMPGPGPLELLPTNQHRVDNSLFDPNAATSKNNWLDIQHNFLKPVKIHNSLDIYEDVYKSDRFGLLACKRYDEKGNFKPYTKAEFTRVSLSPNDPEDDEVDKLKSELTNLDTQLYDVHEYEPETSPYIEDSYRLIEKSSTNHLSGIKNNNFESKLRSTIDKAKVFHDNLELKAHSKTTVSGSVGKDTVVKIDITLNKNYVLNLPFTHTKDGDGTVPRSSEIALLVSPDIKLVKEGLIEGDIGHADIPANEIALNQVEQFLSDVTETLSKQTKQNVTP